MAPPDQVEAVGVGLQRSAAVRGAAGSRAPAPPSPPGRAGSRACSRAGRLPRGPGGREADVDQVVGAAEPAARSVQLRRTAIRRRPQPDLDPAVGRLPAAARHRRDARRAPARSGPGAAATCRAQRARTPRAEPGHRSRAIARPPPAPPARAARAPLGAQLLDVPHLGRASHPLGASTGAQQRRHFHRRRLVPAGRRGMGSASACARCACRADASPNAVPQSRCASSSLGALANHLASVRKSAAALDERRRDSVIRSSTCNSDTIALRATSCSCRTAASPLPAGTTAAARPTWPCARPARRSPDRHPEPEVAPHPQAPGCAGR